MSAHGFGDAPPVRRAARCGVDVELRAVRNHGRDWPAHWHADLQLIATLEGEARARVADDSLTLAHGSLLVVPPRTVHTATAHDPKGDWLFLSMHVAPEVLGGWGGESFAPLLVTARDALARDFTRTVDALFARRGPDPAQACAALMANVRPRLAPHGRPRPARWLEAARAALEADLAAELDLAALGDAASRGRRAFERAFREAFHLSPAAWRAIARVEAAKAVLRSGASVAEAAAAAGLADPRRFSHTFRRVTGLSARTYRLGFSGSRLTAPNSTLSASARATIRARSSGPMRSRVV